MVTEMADSFRWPGESSLGMKYLIGEKLDKGMVSGRRIHPKILPLGSPTTNAQNHDFKYSSIYDTSIAGDFLKLPRPNCRACQDPAPLSEVASSSFPFFSRHFFSIR